MPLLAKFQTCMDSMPLVAILRGLKPEEALAVGQAIVNAGFHILEVPLNSPEPLRSIQILSAAFPNALVGAGTVATAQQVRDIKAAGGQLGLRSCQFRFNFFARRGHPLRSISGPCVGRQWPQVISCRNDQSCRRQVNARCAAQRSETHSCRRHWPSQHVRLSQERRLRIWLGFRIVCARQIGPSGGRICSGFCASLAQGLTRKN